MGISPSLHWTFHLLWNVSLLLPSHCTLRKISTIFHCNRFINLWPWDLRPNARIAIQDSVLVLQPCEAWLRASPCGVVQRLYEFPTDKLVPRCGGDEWSGSNRLSRPWFGETIPPLMGRDCQENNMVWSPDCGRDFFYRKFFRTILYYWYSFLTVLDLTCGRYNLRLALYISSLYFLLWFSKVEYFEQSNVTTTQENKIRFIRLVRWVDNHVAIMLFVFSS